MISQKGSRIKNFKELNINPERNLALKIIELGLQSIDSYKVIEKCLKLKDHTIFVFGKPFIISSKGKLVVVAVGKCAIDATKAVEKILGNKIKYDGHIDLAVSNIDEDRQKRILKWIEDCLEGIERPEPCKNFRNLISFI